MDALNLSPLDNQAPLAHERTRPENDQVRPLPIDLQPLVAVGSERPDREENHDDQQRHQDQRQRLDAGA